MRRGVEENSGVCLKLNDIPFETMDDVNPQNPEIGKRLDGGAWAISEAI